MSASVPVVEVEAAKVASPFATPEGKASVQAAGWALPVAAIDVMNPTESAGNGGLAIRTGPGLTLGWRGLRDGPLRLPAPWLMLSPGNILLVDPHASDRYARQTLRLWKDGSSRFRSELRLSYPDPSALIYVSAATGSELVVARANIEGRLDRPVDVKGTPLPVHTLDSLVVLGYTDSLQVAYVYDDNILADALDPRATWPLELERPLSLAMRNALFTVTPVNSLLLFARLRDEEMVEQATLLLGMGLYGLLPSLPDPYAADVGWLRRQGRSGIRQQFVIQLLVADVAWTKAGADGDPDAVAISFAFAPVAAQSDVFAAWAAAATQVAPVPDPTAFDATSRRGGERIERDRLGAALPGGGAGAVPPARRLE